jgi:aspartate kinase
MHRTLIEQYEFDREMPDILVYLASSMGELAALLSADNISNAVKDTVLSYGERLSAVIISAALRQSGVNSQAIMATDVIVTTDAFGAADFIPDATKGKTEKVLLPLLKKSIVPVVTGFTGATQDGRTTTLGRGGSDYSAAILGYSLQADEIQICTDVNGIYSADPRAVKNAERLPMVTFREASELATFGAKVLHPRTIRPAVSAGIPVRVLSTLVPESEGTRITRGRDVPPRVVAVASKPHVTLVNLYATEMLLSKGFLKRIFAVFEKYAISVDLVSVSEVSVSVTLDNDDHLQEAVSELAAFTTVTTKHMGMISLVGEGIVRVPHIMRNLFSLLDAAAISPEMISLGASDINISFVVETEHVDETVWLLHQKIIRHIPERERNYL